MTHPVHATGAALAVFTLGLIACDPGPSAAVQPKKAPQVKDLEAPPHPVHAALQQVVDACPMTWREVKGCEALATMQRQVVNDPTPMKTLVDVVADASSSERHKDIATQEIERVSRVYFDRAAQGAITLDPDVAATLLRVMRAEVPSRRNKRPQKLIGPTVFMHDLLGKHDDVEALFKDLDPASSPSMLWTVHYGVEALMRYGRLTHVDLVKAYATSPHNLLKSAAFKAPRQIATPTQQEQDVICPWANDDMQSRADTASPNDFGAAWITLRCAQDPAYATSLVNKASALAKEGALERPFGLAFRQLCMPHRLPDTPTHVKECARARVVWEGVIEGEEQPAQARVQAIEALMTQWPDAQTAALMRTHQRSRVAEVARAAQRALDRVEQKKKPSAQTPPRESPESPSP